MASSIRAKCVYNSCVNSRGGEQSGSGQRWRGGLKEGRRTNDDNSNGMANNAVQEASEKKICANSIREFYHVILKWKISDWLICWKMFPFGWTVQCCTAFAPERWAKATQKCCVWKEKKNGTRENVRWHLRRFNSNNSQCWSMREQWGVHTLAKPFSRNTQQTHCMHNIIRYFADYIIINKASIKWLLSANWQQSSVE